MRVMCMRESGECNCVITCFAFRRWVSEPNNYKGDENCAAILNTGYFNDVNCGSEIGYICEMNAEGLCVMSHFVSPTLCLHE